MFFEQISPIQVGQEIETDQRVVFVPVGWEKLPVTDHHTAADA